MMILHKELVSEDEMISAGEALASNHDRRK